MPEALKLLNWYGQYARALPWRSPPGVPPPPPYHVWLSEIMLQQTTVATVVPRFIDWVSRYPHLVALAAAPLEEVMRDWAGLGYYARARNLHACARQVVDEYDGQFPVTEQALAQLPGIGPYTAAAISAIAFGRRAVVIDGNVERVIARLFRVTEPLPAAKVLIRSYADQLTPDIGAGDFAQAMMDLGATICTPRAPNCPACPWRAECMAHRAGDAVTFPRKGVKLLRPTRYGLAFWLQVGGEIWLRRRPAKGLLGGMAEIPSSAWTDDPAQLKNLAAAPLQAPWVLEVGRVRHVFTHFRLELGLASAILPQRPALEDGFWYPIDGLADVGLPTLFRKIVGARGSLDADTPRLDAPSRGL